MNRQKGMSSLLLVLLLLVLGSLTLQGLSVQHQAQVSQATLEKQAMQDSAQVESLLEWGQLLSWTIPLADNCQTRMGITGRVCLRIYPDGTGLLMASSGEQVRWRTAKVSENVVQFESQGWSDFCPRKEVLQCQMP